MLIQLLAAKPNKPIIIIISSTSIHHYAVWHCAGSTTGTRETHSPNTL